VRRNEGKRGNTARIGGASSGVDMVLVVLMAVVGRGVGLVAVRTKGGERRGDDDNTGHGLSRKG
jgi:hypothetical protein